MELIITTTLLNAWPRGIPDSFGTIIQDADHRGEFTFRRGAGESGDDGDEPRDDFTAGDIDYRLALAARCTASFPIAFEASFVPVDGETDKPMRPDMKQHANFGMSRWVIDGGVLANQPLRPALRAIFRQPASRQVRRVLAFVVPDPGEAVQVAADEDADGPGAERRRHGEHDPPAAQPVDQRRAGRADARTTRGSTRSGASAS